ncbi:2-dehydro-3-deoxyphosphogluconate aldolase/4-hydroxy-2-oxoglutarate aldolase [Spiroplasma clarkii]|uniref:2-keto-3-deoxygluconate-6-phosphate aldolase n=1 Tax=Spiroplasma clarkii TaxID=2139 RepID=A0A1Y0L2L3_9MOLU|nr:bifunctional 4-hydroxy-2-oxoglutarate aldolase/2-dehydro-3-deoxy-phosphogluconate aldolase [Spiroplasma clarkii]ARU92246.1 2-dehydro-3-deoxyphosphogluconate aldolase/4-hydroxy-2-oxoglutarate aldolase [Spiroplasma clarkii]ATX71565.1 2-keto-3-deoxygluconate-6-phosphate aldolase [Spiroplasma clarkii]
MSQIKNHIAALEAAKLSTIVRTNDFDHAYKIIKASHEAGIKFIEITLTIPNALELITKTRRDFPELFIGAGTVLNTDQAEVSLMAGAQYLVSPIASVELVKWARAKNVLCIAGAITPTEMYSLWKAGADLIKFFPATAMPTDYIKIIHNPHPEFKFIATGGIDLSNINDYLKAGCIAAGVTADLGGAPIKASYEEIVAIAKQYVNKVKDV